MKINQKIPKDIQLTIKNIKDDTCVCTIKHNKTKLSTWFIFDKYNFETILKKKPLELFLLDILENFFYMVLGLKLTY